MQNLARTAAFLITAWGLLPACSPTTDTGPQTSPGATTGLPGTSGAPGAGIPGAGRGGVAGTVGAAGTVPPRAGAPVSVGAAGVVGAAAGSTAPGGFAGVPGSLTGAGAPGSAAAGSGVPAAGGAAPSVGVPSAAGPVKFGKNIKLNDDTGKARQSEVAIATGPNGLVIAGWMDERAERVCAYSVSTDGGETWSKNVSIKNTANFTGDPSVGIDAGGTLYAVCQQYITAGSSGNIKMMTSSDKGATWGDVQMIQSAPDKPWVAGGQKDGLVIVSWLGNPGGVKRSLDHGKTWDPVQSTGNIVHGTAIVTSTTGLVHVPYNLDSQKNQLRYLRSKDDGKTWEMPRDLLPDMGTFCFQCNPRQHPIVGAASDPTGKIVAITWASKMTGGEGDDDVWVLYSKDGGDTWSKPIKVNDNTTKSRQFESWVAVDNYGRVHVAWTDYRNNGTNATYYARSSDPTKGFEPNVEVTSARGSGSTDFLGDYKGIAVSGDDVLVVWEDTRNDVGDIYFAKAAGAAGPPPAAQ